MTQTGIAWQEREAKLLLVGFYSILTFVGLFNTEINFFFQ